MTIPTSNYSGFIKQIPSDGLSADGMAFLNAHFPGFFAEESLAKSLQAQGINYVQTARGSRATRTGRLRRFSGGASLDRQRYFTLCETSDGLDKGTLVNELYAYADRKVGKRIAILDSTESQETRSMIERTIGGPMPFPHCLLVLVFPTDSNGEPNGPADVAIYRIRVLQVQIADMLDLRFRHVQDWMYETFAELENKSGELGTGGFTMVKRRIASFREMLPTLVCQERGGSILHDAIGHWLRSHSVSALVFPSARANATVRSSESSVVHFSGWNVVIYEGAQASVDSVEDVAFGRMGGWYREEESNIKTLDWYEDESFREWRVVRS